MIQRRPRPRPDSDVPPPLEPMDAAEEEPVGLDEDPAALIDAGDASLDDDVADHLDVGTAEEIRADGEPESGWAAGADDADDADVGDLADEIDDDPAGEGTWLGDDGGSDADDVDGIGVDALAHADDGADGPEGDEDFGLDAGLGDLAGGDPSDDAMVDPLGEGEFGLGESGEPAALALPAPAVPPHAIVHTGGRIESAAVHGARLVLVGEGIHGLNVAPAAALDGRSVTARRAQTVVRPLVHSVVATADGALVAALGDGHFLASDDGVTWTPVGALFADGAEASALTLCAEGLGRRLWVREQGGGLWQSDDAGRTWHESELSEPVRALACERGSADAIVVTGGRSPGLLRSADGRHFAPIGVELPRGAVPVAIARGAGYVALALGHVPGMLIPPDGGRPIPWALLEHATALLVAETDDGAPQIIAAVYDETSGQSTLVSAAVDARGAPRHARRFADLDTLLPTATDPDAGEDARVSALLALDPGARRVLAVTPRGVVLVARAGGAPARPGPTGTDD